jgi:RIO kinase 1
VSLGNRATERIERRQRRNDEEHRERREEQYQVLEEVFDKATLMTVYGLLNRGVIRQLLGVVKSGKESRVYRGVGPDNESLAVKIYLTVSAEFKRGMVPYIEGDPRFKSVKHDSKSLVYTWAQKEFKNLEKARGADVRVPKPIVVEKNVLIMEFIGENGVCAPTLKEESPRNPKTMYKTILSDIKKLYRKARLVHGDLSEYNIMNDRGEPVIFDMGQSVLVEHPLARELLLRDLKNLNIYFSKLGVAIKEENYLSKWVTSI